MRFLCSHCENVLEREELSFNSPITCDHCQQTTLVPASRFALGAVFGDFVVMGALGEGRICTLHDGHQLSLRREVVLQILKRELQDSRRYRQQFVNDARIMARMIHPSIVHAYAIGEEDNINYAAIERVQARDLQSLLRQETRLPLCHALEIARQMADAIDYAWEEHKIIHRDIKPGNILWLVDGTAKLQGFRMACTADAMESQQEEDAIVGSPPYLCPEQLLGSPMDVRSDIYSLGATLYHLITGRLPFLGQTAEEVAWKHLDEPLVPPSSLNGFIPERVSDIVAKMMAKEPAARFETARELRDELAKALEALDEGLPSPASLALSLHREGSSRRSILPPLPRTGTVIIDRNEPSTPQDIERTYRQLRVPKPAPTEVYDPPEPEAAPEPEPEPNPAFEATMYADSMTQRPRRQGRPPIVRGAAASMASSGLEAPLAPPDPRMHLGRREAGRNAFTEDDIDTQRFIGQEELAAAKTVYEEPEFDTQEQYDLELDVGDYGDEPADPYAAAEPGYEEPAYEEPAYDEGYDDQDYAEPGYAEQEYATESRDPYSEGPDTVVYDPPANEPYGGDEDFENDDEIFDEDTQVFARGGELQRPQGGAPAMPPGAQEPGLPPAEGSDDSIADVELDEDGAYELD